MLLNFSGESNSSSSHKIRKNFNLSPHLPHYGCYFKSSNSDSSELLPRQTSTLRREKGVRCIPFSSTQPELKNRHSVPVLGFLDLESKDPVMDQEKLILEDSGQSHKCDENLDVCHSGSSFSQDIAAATSRSDDVEKEDSSKQKSSGSFDSDQFETKVCLKKDFLQRRVDDHSRLKSSKTIEKEKNDTLDSNDILITENLRQRETAKYPSENQQASVAIQTSPLSIQPDNNIANVISDRIHDIDTSSVESPQSDRFTGLMDIEKRIKLNSEKINDALRIYNSKIKKKSDLQTKAKIITTQSINERDSKFDSFKETTTVDSKLLAPSNKARDRKGSKTKSSDIVTDSKKEVSSTTPKYVNNLPKDKKAIKFMVSFRRSTSSKNDKCKTLAQELVDKNKENEIMSLQVVITFLFHFSHK